MKDNLKPYDPDRYEGLLRRVVEHVNARGRHLYVQDVSAGADPAYSVPYRFVGEYAVHAMFAHNMFPKRVEGMEDAEDRRWTMLNVQSFRCEPARDGSLSDRAAIIDFRNRICLVAGRADYCGLVKKTIFTVMNFLLPNQGFLSMHCSANAGDRGDSAILFGLSGTGKTTLSADPDRRLIGDDETGWTDTGISNLEDGCYAKLIDLDKEAEPVIAAALSMPGTIIRERAAAAREADRGYGPAGTRSDRRVDHREHSVFIPSVLQSERRGRRARRSPRDDRAVDRRRIRSASAGVSPRRQAGDVSLRTGLHRQARGHRGGAHRAAGDVQRMFRRAVHVASPERLREVARRQDAGARGALRPAQHRVEWRPRRRGGSDLDRGYPSTARHGARRRVRRSRNRHAPDLRAAHSDVVPRGRCRHPRIHVRCGATRVRTMRTPSSCATCSGRTSKVRGSRHSGSKR